jgi:hypothetical protein
VLRLERLLEVLVGDLDAALAELLELQARPDDVLLPLEERLAVLLQDAADELAALDLDRLAVLVQGRLDLGGGDVDAGLVAGALDDPLVDQQLDLVGPLAGDQVLAEFFAGDRLGVVDVGDDALAVVGGRGGGGRRRGRGGRQFRLRAAAAQPEGHRAGAAQPQGRSQFPPPSVPVSHSRASVRASAGPHPGP